MQSEIDDQLKNGIQLSKEESLVPPEILINVGTLRMEVGKT